MASIPTAVTAEAAVQSLAGALTTAMLDRPVGQRLNPDAVLAVLRLLAAGWDDARLATWLAAEEARIHKAYAAVPHKVGAEVPRAWVDHGKAAVTRPVTLHAPLVLRLMDQPQVRKILAELLQVTLSDFVKRASTSLSESKLMGGIMDRARGAVSGGITGGLLSAVGQGLNGEAERRVREFVDGAVGMALQQLVTQVCDPRRADAYGQLRAGILQSAVDTPMAEWARQLQALQPVQVVHALVRAVRDTVPTPAFETWFRQQHARVTAHETRPLRDVLEDAGALGPVTAALQWVVADELAWALHHPALDGWWAAHVADAPASAEPVAPKPSKPARKKKG